MSHAAAAQDETEDRYHTQVDAGDVRLFTLDQLDAAFNVGLIHENTYVCLEGSTEWLTLGEVAGLGDDEEPVSAPFPVAAPVSSYSPPPSMIPAAPYASPYSVAPMTMPRSIAPVVNDLAFDDDYAMRALRPKRRIGKVLALLTVVGLAAAGFAVVQSGGIKGLKLPKLGSDVGQASAASLSLSSLKDAEHSTTAPTPAPEAAKPEPPKVEETKTADTAPTPAAAADKASDKTADKADADKKTDDRFSEDMKAALLNKDKQHVADQKHKKAARAAVVAKQKPSSKAAKGSPGFKTGGSAYDPLNGKL